MPNSLYDIHLHTHYSDGRATPAEILHYAADIGLKVVSITDHDNLNAYPEAANVAASLGLELIPGIEFTTRWDVCLPADPHSSYEDADLLGYFFDPHNTALQAFAHRAQEDLFERIHECCQRITQDGYPIDMDDLRQENPRYPGTTQLLHALIRKNLAPDWNAGLAIFHTHWRRVRLCQVPIKEAIAALHAAGGIAILAHPVAFDCQEGWLNAAQLRPLVDDGLDGIEIYHPRLSYEARAHFTLLAKELNLLPSGGSDEHGWRDGFSRLGSEPITPEIVENLRKKAKDYNAAC